FWDTASASTSKNKEMEITATIDGRVKTITEASIRRHLKIEDSDGIPTLPNAESFEQLLFMGVKKLEHKVKASKSRRRTKIVFSDDEEGRTSADTEILLEQEEPTELVEDPGVVKRVQKREKIQEKLSVEDDEFVHEKTKKRQLNKKDLGIEEAIRLQNRLMKKKTKICQDAEIAKQLQEEIDIARQEQEKYDLAQAFDHDVLKYHAQQNRSFFKAKVWKNMYMYFKNQGGYKQSHFKGMSYEDIRHIFERVWDQNQSFVPKDYEIEKEVMKDQE
ncbi:hypothetical protein Tco_1000596, partial [Tanacetum coccineum]